MEDTVTRSARIAARVPPGLREKLERAAAQRRWSLSTAIEVAVEHWLEEELEEDGQPVASEGR